MPPYFPHFASDLLKEKLLVGGFLNGFAQVREGRGTHGVVIGDD